MTDDRFLTRVEAAARLRALGLPIAVATLATAVTRGNGPPCYRFGHRALYRERELLAWAEAKLRPAGRRTPEAA
jgi:hypothetical protein